MNSIFKIKTKRILTFIFILLCTVFLNLFPVDKIDTEVDEHLITVFIHGTILPPLPFSSKTLKGISKFMRFSGSHKYLPISDLGLIEIDQNKNIVPKNKSEDACKQIIEWYKTVYQKCTSNPVKSHSVYTFGWDGSLSSKQRRVWGKKLYKKLIKEIDEINKTIKPKSLKIELVAHSHGGNVALNLERAEDLERAEEKFKKNLSIDRLILLGTPVQSETKKLIHSSIFKKIYHIYSLGDNIQTIDCISELGSFAKGRFDADTKKIFTLPSNLVQVETYIGNMKPGHNELWTLGDKGNFLYRKKLPINPFPVVVFVPLIVDFLEANMPLQNDLCLQMDKKEKELNFSFLSDTTQKDSSNKTLINLDILQNQIDVK